MNFLAHCALAEDASEAWSCSPAAREGLLAGAVIGDFVKGTIPTDWPQALRAGVRLHRRIDALSARLPALDELNDRFGDDLRRFAPILTDLMMDHSLSLNWQVYYPKSVDRFSTQCYAALNAHAHFLSERGTRFVAYMQAEDLLANYHRWPHIADATRSVFRRLNRLELAERADREMQQHMDHCHETLNACMPEFRQHWSQWDAFAAIAAE